MIALADKVAPPSTTGQRTERQYGGGAFNVFGGSVRAMPGVNETALVSTGGIWPGWGSLLWGTYWTYRAMLRHPTIAYVVSQVLGPVTGGAWLVDSDEDADETAVEWVKENIIASRDEVITHACRSVLFGNAPFEVVWNGEYGIEHFVPLLQDATTVLRDDNGKGPFAGLQNGQAKLAPAESLYILNLSDALGGEPGDDYGRSRLENIRDTSWVGWLDTMRRLGELEDRVSGVVPLLEVPKTKPDEFGKTMADYANAALPNFVHPRSQGMVLENPALGEVDADANPNTYKQLKSQMTPIDTGSRAPGQAAMLEKLKYLDTKIGEGLYRGARTLFATQGGTKADAEQHTANAEPDCEAIDNMIAAQVNAQTCRVGLTLNFGPDVLKKVRGIKPAPLVDQDQARASKTIAVMLANPTLAVALGMTMDGDKLLDQARIPLRQEGSEAVKFADMLMQSVAAAQAAKAAQQQAMGGGGAAGANGNGKRTDPRVARAAQRFNGN